MKHFLENILTGDTHRDSKLGHRNVVLDLNYEGARSKIIIKILELLQLQLVGGINGPDKARKHFRGLEQPIFYLGKEQPSFVALPLLNLIL